MPRPPERPPLRLVRPGDDPVAETMGARLVPRLLEYARSEFADWFFETLESTFRDPGTVIELAGPWILYHAEADGQPVVAWFLADPRNRLTAAERRWLEQQRLPWLGLWEVTAVTPGVSVALTDLLTGTERVVRERTASRTLVVRDTILARVVDHDHASELNGVYPRALGPEDAAWVLEEIRRKLRRRRKVQVERLRSGAIERHLIALWEAAVEGADARQRKGPDLRNTDGDEMLWTVDHFACSAQDRARIVELLRALDDVGPPEPDDPDQLYTIMRPQSARPDETRFTILGAFRFTRRGMVLETNSLRRADALRRKLEDTAAGMLRHQLREHPGGQGGEPTVRPIAVPAEETESAVKELMDRYYRDWLDQPIPALDGVTPRAAAQSAAGRRKLEPLLKQMEYQAGHAPPGIVGPDVAFLRRELGLTRG